MKKNLLGIIVFAVSVMFANTVFADWVQVGDKWTYEENGSVVKSTWKLLKRGNDYSSYYFDENGFMVTGVWKIDNQYYSFKNDGIANSKAAVMIDSEKYETGNKGLIEDYPSEYFQDNFKGSWQTVGNNYKYIIDGVPLVSAWRLIYSNDKLSWFYFDGNGFMVTGLRRLPDNNFYYFDVDGAAKGNSTVSVYKYGTINTLKKGQVVDLPNGFDINEYLKESQEAKIEEEQQKKIQESQQEEYKKLQAERESKSLKDAEIQNQERKIQADIAAAEYAAQKAVQDASRVSLLSTEEGIFTLDADESKIIVSYKKPILKGANAAQLNGIIETKLQKIIEDEVESRLDLGGVVAKKNIKISSVSVQQDFATNILTLYFSGDFSFAVNLNTITFEMWAEPNY